MRYDKQEQGRRIELVEKLRLEGKSLEAAVKEAKIGINTYYKFKKSQKIEQAVWAGEPTGNTQDLITIRIPRSKIQAVINAICQD